MPSIRRSPCPARLSLALIALAALTAACDEDFVDPDLIDAAGSRVTVVSGNNQSGALGALLPQALRVQVTDERGDPAPQQRVEFRTVIGDGLFSATSGVTDFAGFTQVRFVPLTVGELMVQAGQPGGASVSFSLASIDSSQVRDPALFQKVGGDNQTGTVGTIVPQPLTVQVLNADGNPIERLPVLFTATTDGTLLLTARTGDFTRQDSLGNSPAASDSIGRQIVSFTNESGVAGVLLRLSTRPSTNSVTASSTPSGGTSASVVFTATSILGGTSAADSLVKISGDDQNVTFDTTGTGGTPSHEFNPMVLQVTDRFGNPVSGLTVFFRVSSGFGTLSNSTAVTDENGFAQTTFTSEAGSSGGIAVSASVPGVGAVLFTGSISAVGETPEEEPPPPAPGDSLSIVSGDNQTFPADTTVSHTFNPLVVKAFRGSAPLPGVTVTFRVSTGNGTFDESGTATHTAVTDANGEAEATYTSAADDSEFAVSASSSVGTVSFDSQPPGGG